MERRNNRENFQHGSTGQKLARFPGKNVWSKLDHTLGIVTMRNHKTKVISHF